MKVGDRVVYIDDNKSIKGLVVRTFTRNDEPVNWIISWENGIKIQYTKDQMDILIDKVIKKDFQYYRTIKLEELGI
jgi:hypothetical protein